MILQILRHIFAGIQACFNLRMRNIASYNNRAVERKTGTNRVFGENLANIRHRLIKVNLYGIALTCCTQFFRDKAGRIRIHLLNPNTVFIDFALDIAVGRAAYAKADGARSAMSRQTHYAHVMRHVLSAELRTKTNLVAFLQELLFELDIAESATGLIASSGEFIVVMGRSELHGEQILLSRCTTNHDSDMIGRTSSRTEALHLLYKERDEGTGVLNARFGLLIEVGLICRTTTFGYTKEMILHTLCCFDINLCGEVAFRIYLIVHVEGRVLAVTQVLLSVGLENAKRERLFVTIARPHLLTLFAMDDGGTGILTKRQLPLACHFSITKERERYILIISAGFRIAQDLSHLLIVAATKHEAYIAECSICHLC